MATLSTAARNAAADAVVDLVDAGTGAGKLVMLTSADAVLATVTLPDPAFGDAASGTATAGAITATTYSASGDIDRASLRDSDDTEVMSLTVSATGGGGDVQIAGGLTVGSGAALEVTSATITMPAS